MTRDLICSIFCVAQLIGAVSSRADSPADSCGMFTRDVGSYQVGEWPADLLNRGTVVRLCGRAHLVTRVFVRSAPLKLPQTAVCSLSEISLALGISPKGAKTSADVHADRIYMGSAPNACPKADSDEYVLVYNVTGKEFEQVSLWWERFQTSALEQQGLRQRGSADEQARVTGFWRALSNKNLIFRAYSRYPASDRKDQYSATFTVGGKLDPEYLVTLQQRRDQLTPENVTALRP